MTLVRINEKMPTPLKTHLKEPSWLSCTEALFSEPDMAKLSAFLENETLMGHEYFPTPDKIFNALNHVPFHRVRIIIMGQDPYHGEGQAHGLAFSVPEGVPHPPSLKNIFKELQRDSGCPPPDSGNLEKWTREGILLLNSTLTVRARQAASHRNQGWETFTDHIIHSLSEQRSGLIFMLWGNDAQKKEHLINTSKHHILKTSHPSPLSSHKGFSGSGIFSKANNILEMKGQTKINWCLA
jgi:uracil-DNA glycosylase